MISVSDSGTGTKRVRTIVDKGSADEKSSALHVLFMPIKSFCTRQRPSSLYICTLTIAPTGFTCENLLIWMNNVMYIPR